ncbi:RHS repeat-associated core domain-containing protein [Microbacterium enclense]|uniref:RHS repeat-associated core domain-containing protein n=1 Tax=Microbacterium enclense TaxID=993073 RepID=UPI0036DAB7A0
MSTSDGATYEYDAAGARSSATVDGRRTTFAHDPAGRLRGTATDDRRTSYAYDGLGRRVETRDSERFGTDDRTQTWDGLLPVNGGSARHGASALVRDAAGDPLAQSGPTGVSWLLGDMRDVTATADAGGVLNELVSYGDFGGAGFESPGWDGAVGYDRQPGDASLGLDEYYARSYDAGAGSWLEPDSWRGSATSPQSMNRYAYVENSPVAFADLFGFARHRPGGGRVKRKPTNANRRYHSSIPPYVQMQLTKGQSRYNGGGPTSRGPSVGRPGSPSALALRSPGGYRNNPSALSQVRAPILRSQQLQSLRHQMTTMGCGQFDWGCRGVYRGGSSHVGSAAVRTLATGAFAANTLAAIYMPWVALSPGWHVNQYVTSALANEQAGMLAAWAMGVAPRTTIYGEDSVMTRVIKAAPETQRLGDTVRLRLATCGARCALEEVDGYRAGSPGMQNPNFVRDLNAAVSWPTAGDRRRTLLALGTYDLGVGSIQVTGDRSAVVQFIASNNTTLGSATRGLGEEDDWNRLAGKSGPFSKITQNFIWEETVTW